MRHNTEDSGVQEHMGSEVSRDTRVQEYRITVTVHNISMFYVDN